jgi:hypothetical protein
MTTAENLIDLERNTGLKELVAKAAKKRMLARAARRLVYALRCDQATAEKIIARLELESPWIPDVRGLESKLGHDSGGDLLRVLLISKLLASDPRRGFKVCLTEETP